MLDVVQGFQEGDVLAIEDLDEVPNDLLISDVASSHSSGSVEAHARRALGGSFRAPASPSEVCPALSPRGGYGDSPLSASSPHRSSGNGSTMPSYQLPGSVPAALSSGQRQAPPDATAPSETGSVGSSLKWLTQMEGLVVTAEQPQLQRRPQPQQLQQPTPPRPITPRAPGESQSVRKRGSFSSGASSDSKQLNTQQVNQLSMHAALDDAGQLKELLKRMDTRLNEHDSDGDRTPLHWAAARGHARCVELLLAAGSDASLDDAEGRTAATIALHFGHDALAFRIEQGAPSVDEKKVYQGLGEVSLHAALAQPSQLKRALELPHAAPNERDSDGDRYALHWAAARGAHKCVELLLAAGADPLVADRRGHTPAAVALALRQPVAYGILDRAEKRAAGGR